VACVGVNLLKFGGDGSTGSTLSFQAMKKNIKKIIQIKAGFVEYY
jgi:hypothetical protein